MKKPKMILFDYGQTLVNEAKFDGVKGTSEVLKYAIVNKYNKTAEEIQAVADEINYELGRFDPLKRHQFQIEVPNFMFTAYLYESLGIRLSIPSSKLDQVFWDAASPGTATEGIAEFLHFLKEQGIRTGVISNISYCRDTLEERIHKFLPNHEFEFIIATSEYMFRKPNRRIFDLALEKAGLPAEDVWYIGDQYECDIVGSRIAGMFPVWYIGAIDMPYTMKEEVLTITNWNELMRSWS
ncbi:HAD-IA family hydrolase [Anaerocolumna sp. AGMB13025]|uniref:HAD family hydrolase n=1 Tax=Anaerocolumna sp. AGMB13025 TaxID=3039116 RepID=UPI00241BF19C|nr:HAD-IA family hydrolase [Anaerocolumna sp. AGMB13025]WFR59904.1 HAD-IA family hydrolase [Anaerocolumna sp. AGMB13025]